MPSGLMMVSSRVSAISRVTNKDSVVDIISPESLIGIPPNCSAIRSSLTVLSIRYTFMQSRMIQSQNCLKRCYSENRISSCMIDVFNNKDINRIPELQRYRSQYLLIIRNFHPCLSATKICPAASPCYVHSWSRHHKAGR